MKKITLTQKKVLIAVLSVFTIGTWYFSISSFSAHKQDIVIQVSDVLNKVAFPYRLAKLYSQPRDMVLSIPIRGLDFEDLANTWGDARSGGRTHQGIDIFANRGTPVYAVAPGYVLRVGNNTLGGNIVYTVGAGGVRYYYAHLDSHAEGLEVGQKVTTDTVIGFVGNTGNAETTAPHLHFGVYFRGPENPYLLFNDSL